MKKKKEEDRKEEKLMQQADPELVYALSNDKFTEDMLEMLLKQGDKKTPKSFYD